MRSLAASALCLLSLQIGCSQDLTWTAVNHMIATDFPDVPSVSTDSLGKAISDSTSTNLILLDARSREEYAVSHLPGARRVDPGAQTFPVLDTVDRDAPIVVYCSVGYRSGRIAARLRKVGFTRVSNLRGSIFRWANEGRPVVRNGTPVREVHPYDDRWGTLLDDTLHAYSVQE